MKWLGIGVLLFAGCSAKTPTSSPTGVPVPALGMKSWQIAGEPDIGALTSPSQQPVDFALWQAADSSWQLWSCIRGTKEPGNTRLFYRWEGANITDSNWTPKGVAMHADTGVGEAAGGLQAPYVLNSLSADGKTTIWRMFYGTWKNIAEQTSTDGKSFQRVIRAGGKVGIFDDGDSKRDPMLLPIGGVDYLYFTASPSGQGADYLATSSDGTTFSTPKVVAFGGQAGKGFASAECPFVLYRKDVGLYYLFRTQRYGITSLTSVYASADPTDFGIDDDSHLVTTLPIAAPEIHRFRGVDYIAYLLPSLQGIEISTLDWRLAP